MFSNPATTGADDVGPYIISTVEIGAKALNLAGSTVDITQLQHCVDGLTDQRSRGGYRGGPACALIAEIGVAVYRALLAA